MSETMAGDLFRQAWAQESAVGLLIAVLVIGNIVQWRTNSRLVDTIIKLSTSTATALTLLNERLAGRHGR